MSQKVYILAIMYTGCVGQTQLTTILIYGGHNASRMHLAARNLYLDRVYLPRCNAVTSFTYSLNILFSLCVLLLSFELLKLCYGHYEIVTILNEPS